MTRREFESIPEAKWNEDIGEYNSLVILPARTARDLHDSGYRFMSFVAVKDGEPIALLGGCSDVVHFDGISGQGRFNGFGWDGAKSRGWNMDCLPKSGLLHIWPNSHKMTNGSTLSSFEIWGV